MSSKLINPRHRYEVYLDFCLKIHPRCTKLVQQNVVFQIRERLIVVSSKVRLERDYNDTFPKKTNQWPLENLIRHPVSAKYQLVFSKEDE